MGNETSNNQTTQTEQYDEDIIDQLSIFGYCTKQIKNAMDYVVNYKDINSILNYVEQCTSMQHVAITNKIDDDEEQESENNNISHHRLFLQQEHSLSILETEYIEPKPYNKSAVLRSERDILNGYIKRYYGYAYPKDIVQIIRKYYCINLYSSLLTSDEEMSLLDLLWLRLSRKSLFKSMEFRLLYRASEKEYNSDIFHELCDNQGPTLVIIHNEYDHVYGGYAQQSWNWNESTISDPDAFLWVVRPTVNVFGFKKGGQSGKDALWNYEGYGPMFGNGNDIWISDACHMGQSNGVEPGSFEFDPNVLCGGRFAYVNSKRQWCVVREYEVFAVTIS